MTTRGTLKRSSPVHVPADGRPQPEGMRIVHAAQNTDRFKSIQVAKCWTRDFAVCASTPPTQTCGHVSARATPAFAAEFELNVCIRTFS
jgi:hypothetical protein